LRRIERLPRLLLHAEGLVVAGAAIAVYFHAGYQWWLLLALALAPDLSLVAFAAGQRLGAVAYDVVHTSVLPLISLRSAS